MAEACLAMGLHLSFAGMLTYKNPEDLRATAATLSIDRLMVETDRRAGWSGGKVALMRRKSGWRSSQTGSTKGTRVEGLWREEWLGNRKKTSWCDRLQASTGD